MVRCLQVSPVLLVMKMQDIKKAAELVDKLERLNQQRYDWSTVSHVYSDSIECTTRECNRVWVKMSDVPDKALISIALGNLDIKIGKIIKELIDLGIEVSPEQQGSCYGEACGDNRFEIIEKAKKHILEATNIDSSIEEMVVLDDILFRCWQMGWLEQYGPTGPKAKEHSNETA